MAQTNMICEVEDCECVYSKQPLPHEIPYPPLKWLKPETQDVVFQKRDEEPPPMFCIIDSGIIGYIANTTNGNYAQSCLDYYAKCTCCKRHQKNKPTVWKPWVELSHNQPRGHAHCLCACRTMSRHICRLFPDWDDSVYE
jgi:hypothetical protein